MLPTASGNSSSRGMSSPFRVLIAIVIVLILVITLALIISTLEQDTESGLGEQSGEAQGIVSGLKQTIAEVLAGIDTSAPEGGGGGGGNGGGGFAGEQSGAVKVAFVGDQSMSSEARAVLQIIQSEGVDIVVHSGDYDYEGDPDAWNDMLNDELGSDFPYVASIGNHDIGDWDEYKDVLQQRVDNAQGLECTGDIGTQAMCTYNGVAMVFSSKGVCEQEFSDDGYPPDRYPDLCGSDGTFQQYDHEAFIREQLGNSGATWRICSWHQNHNLFQPGDKPTTVPLSQYDACREAGAIVATAHEHSYARTHQMNNFENQDFVETTPIQVGGGSTFAFVSAISGWGAYTPDEDRLDDPWWALRPVTALDDPAQGALICTLNPDGTGHCYFKNTDGQNIDEFDIQSAN